MKINFTKTYRIWHILTILSASGIFISYFLGYDLVLNRWKELFLGVHIFFIATLISAVSTRVYMAISKNNAVPMMHLFNAKNNFQRLVAFFYICMCSVLLTVLFSDLYILLNTNIQNWILYLRDGAISIFMFFIAFHISYVVYNNIIFKTKTLKKLFSAVNSKS